MTSTMKLLAAAAMLALPAAAGAQVFSDLGSGGAIPDGSGSATPGAPLVSTITVPGSFTGGIISVSVGFSGLSHTYVGDLHARLIHPDGTTSIDLLNRPGRGSTSTFGFGSDFLGGNSYTFSDNGAVIFDVTPPASIPSGDYRPSSNPNGPAQTAGLVAYTYTAQSFADTFGGLSAVGTWTLEIRDYGGGDTGSVGTWNLIIEVPAPGSVALLGMGGLVAARRRRR